MLGLQDANKVAKWCGKILHDLKHKSSKGLFKKLDELLQEPPSDNPVAMEALQKGNAYFRKHTEHMDYAENAAFGVLIGSGSVESLCSQFPNRLKRTGQFWSEKGFAAPLSIIVRKWNEELDLIWMTTVS